MRYAQLKDIKTLKSPVEQDKKAVSIFIPTHKITLPDTLRADKIRFKNALRDVEAELSDHGYKQETIKKYLNAIEKVVDQEDFWLYRDNGLAIYATESKATYYDLPLEIDYAVYVNSHFIISPLLVANNDKYQFIGLDLNLHEPRLFLGSQVGMERILIDQMPGEIEVALRIDEYQEQQQHSTSPGGTRDAHAHGHGGRNDNKTKDINRYLRLIDATLRESQIAKSNLPLLLAGDVGLVSSYRHYSKYRNIKEEFVSGNSQHKSVDELHKEFWSLIVEDIEKQDSFFTQLLETARHKDGMQRLITGEHIRRAARRGQVATLALSLIRKTYDSVINRFEQRFKITLPSSTKQLMNIEKTARVVMNYGGEIRSMLYQDVSDNAKYIQAIARSK